MYIIVEHVPQWCCKIGYKVGMCPEHASETAHSKFKKFLQKRRIAGRNTKGHLTDLISDVSARNGKHV